jgi:hypothetical protein
MTRLAAAEKLTLPAPDVDPLPQLTPAAAAVWEKLLGVACDSLPAEPSAQRLAIIADPALADLACRSIEAEELGRPRCGLVELEPLPSMQRGPGT